MLLSGVVTKVLNKGRKPQTRRHQIVSLVLDEAFFLVVSPWLLILPAEVIVRWLSVIPGMRAPAAGIVTALAGFSYSVWAVSCQWRQGGGTPSLNAP
ncbi:MAG: hypothetical protein WC655_19225, partial [Candidatus Hydrogenedentales bacterium]